MKQTQPWITFCRECGAAPRLWEYKGTISLWCGGGNEGLHTPVRVAVPKKRSHNETFRIAREKWVRLNTGR